MCVQNAIENTNRYNCIYVSMHVAGRRHYQQNRLKKIQKNNCNQTLEATCSHDSSNIHRQPETRHNATQSSARMPMAQTQNPKPSPKPIPIYNSPATMTLCEIPYQKPAAVALLSFSGRKVLVVGQLFGCFGCCQTFSQRQKANIENASFWPNKLQVQSLHSTWPTTWLTSLPTVWTAIRRGLLWRNNRICLEHSL